MALDKNLTVRAESADRATAIGDAIARAYPLESRVQCGALHAEWQYHVRHEGATGPRSASVWRDTGPGIAPEHVDRIFDRFYRIDQSRSRDLGGTGLGLAIARLLAELQGGRIEVESTPGRGAPSPFGSPRLSAFSYIASASGCTEVDAEPPAPD